MNYHTNLERKVFQLPPPPLLACDKKQSSSFHFFHIFSSLSIRFLKAERAVDMQIAEQDADAAEAQALHPEATADATAHAAAAALAAAATTGNARNLTSAATVATPPTRSSQVTSPELALEAASEARLLATLEQIEQMSRYNEAANRRRRASWTHRNSLRGQQHQQQQQRQSHSEGAHDSLALAAASMSPGNAQGAPAKVRIEEAADEELQHQDDALHKRRVTFSEVSQRGVQEVPRRYHSSSSLDNIPPFSSALGGSEGVQPGELEPASSAPKALNGVFEWASAMLQTTGLTSSSTSSEERSSIDPHHSHLTQPDIMEKGSSKKPGSLLTNNYNHNSNNNNNKSKDSFNNKNIGNRRNKRISSSSSSRGNTRNPQALGGVKVGDFVHWAHADHDIPLGAVGLVAGFTKDTARAKCRFPNGTFALRPNTLVMKCLIPELLLQHLNFFLLLERVAILKNVWCFCACLLPQLSRFSPCLLISSGNLCCSCRRNHHHGVLKAYRRRILVLLCTTISTVA